jgi:hypothetical protein
MRFLCIATLLSTVLSASGVTATPDEIVLLVRPSGAVRVPVEINGQGPLSFLLDTGSSHSTVSSELVDRLALPVIAKARVKTPAGVQLQLVVRLERMAIGNASVGGMLPSVVSLAELRNLEPGIDGVIGQDFLKDFDYTIDYRRKRLRWTAQRGDERERLPLICAGGRSLVQLPGRGRGAPLLMVPDSGAEGFVIFERRGRTELQLDGPGQLREVSALGMRRIARSAVLRELQVGAATLRDQPAVVVVGGGSGPLEPDGLLPLHSFSTVSFNNSEGYMLVAR